MADQNPYCMRCSRHLGMPFHETNEHDEAARLAQEMAEVVADWLQARILPDRPEADHG